MKKSAPKDDPWTTPLAEQGVATSNGRHSAAARADEAVKRSESEILDALEDSGQTPVAPAGDPSLKVNDAGESEANDKDAHKDGTEENPPS
jgi:hypothetical protein